jgi:hypothetical protein
MCPMPTLTQVHVVISLVAIAAGFVVMFGLLQNKRLDRWTAGFLATTVLTNVTAFMFTFRQLLPAHIIGAVSLVLLAIALVARYQKAMVGRWRTIYVVTGAVSLYLNVFVGVVQAFMKIPALTALAPTQSEPPFLAAQLVVLLLFIALTVGAVKRFRGE